MAQLSHRVKVFSDGSVLHDSAPNKVYWRVRHDTTLWRPNLPEVFPFLPSHYTYFTRAHQLLEKQLNAAMTSSKWHNLHLGGNDGDKATAFNNRQGFEMEGDPRVDFVNGRNTSSPLPRQEALVCGGAILTQKYIDRDYLYPEYIDGNLPVPSKQYVEDNFLCFDAVTVDGGPDGAIIIRKFPQGDGQRVRILLLASKPIRISLNNVERVYPPFPSPYRHP